MSRRLEGQTAWISGAASGIGAGTARLFAREGASVALADHRADHAEALAQAIRDQGGQALAVPADVAVEETVRDSIDRAAEHFGGLQIVVNSAGIVRAGLLHETSAEEWDRLMAVNVGGVFFAVKHAIPHLRRNPRSYVINLGSISSFVGQASTPAYTTSKAAVLGLSRSIALDYASIGLRCNCICPGITDTPMLREHLNKTADPEATLVARLRRVPLATALTPTDIARSALYFACEDSAGVTGTSLVVDGGYLAAAEWDAG